MRESKTKACNKVSGDTFDELVGGGLPSLLRFCRRGRYVAGRRVGHRTLLQCLCGAAAERATLSWCPWKCSPPADVVALVAATSDECSSGFFAPPVQFDAIVQTLRQCYARCLVARRYARATVKPSPAPACPRPGIEAGVIWARVESIAREPCRPTLLSHRCSITTSCNNRIAFQLNPSHLD